MYKRIFCYVLSVFLALGAAACKNKDAEVSFMKYVEEEFGQIEELGKPGMMAINSQGQPVIQNISSNKPEYLVLGQDGKPVKKIVCDIEGQTGVFCIDSQDNLYIVSNAPNEASITQYINVTDLGGNVKKTLEIGRIDQNPEGYRKRITGIAVDSNGNIALSRINDKVLFLDKNGMEKGTLGDVLYEGTVQTDSDNNVIIYGTRVTDYKNVLQKFNPITGKNLWTTIFEPKKEEGISIEQANIIRCDSKDGCIYLLTGDAIEKFDSNGKHMGKELDFKEHSALSSELQPKDFCIGSEKIIWLLTSESQLTSITKTEADPDYLPRFGFYRYTLKRFDGEDEIPINISVPSSSRLLDVAISKFNKENPGYRIIAKEFGTGKRKEKYDEKYINTLNTELMSGLGPDIISVASLPYEKYIAKNVLADLSEMMEKDSGFEYDKFFENIFNAMKIDGRLYSMPVSIMINALVSNKEVLSDRSIIFNHTTWTWDDFNKIDEGISGGSGVYTVPPNTGYVLLSGTYGRFIDIEKKKASFDSGEFENMLLMAKNLGMDSKEISSTGFDALFDTAVRGTVVFSPQVISDIIMLSATKVLLGGEIEIYNLPGNDVNHRGGAFSVGEAYAINNNSRYKEKAWEFIKIFLSEEIQTLDEMKGFPVSKNALKVIGDRNNELLTSSQVSTAISAGSGEPVTPQALTEKEISQLREYIESLQTYCHIDNKVAEIIRTEAESFFNGKKTADEAAKAIQQKVNIYLNE